MMLDRSGKSEAGGGRRERVRGWRAGAESNKHADCTEVQKENGTKPTARTAQAARHGSTSVLLRWERGERAYIESQRLRSAIAVHADQRRCLLVELREGVSSRSEQGRASRMRTAALSVMVRNLRDPVRQLPRSGKRGRRRDALEVGVRQPLDISRDTRDVGVLRGALV